MQKKGQTRSTAPNLLLNTPFRVEAVFFQGSKGRMYHNRRSLLDIDTMYKQGEIMNVIQHYFSAQLIRTIL